MRTQKIYTPSRRAAALSVVAALAGALLLAGCGASSSASAPQGPGGKTQGGRRQGLVPVQATAVEVGLLSADRDSAGLVVPVTQSQVAAQVAGVVARTPRLAGDWVRTGDLVVQLDDAQFKLAAANAQAALDSAKINLDIGLYNENQANPKLALDVQSAQSALDSAKKTYESQKALFDLGGISASQLDNSKTQLSQAQSNLEGAKTALDQNQKSGEQNIAQLRVAVNQATIQLQQAQLNLQYTSIRAPFAGQLAAINVNPGMYLGLNTPAFTLVSAEREINFNAPPSDALALPVGTAVRFNYSGKDYPIRVSQAPSAPINGLVPMVATVGSLNLPFGSVGTVSYPVSMAKGALVPVAALATLENKNYVFAIDSGKAVRKYVIILAEAGITAAVTGLDPGVVVVMNPPPGLLEGAQVQPIMVQNASATAGQTAGKP